MYRKLLSTYTSLQIALFLSIFAYSVVTATLYLSTPEDGASSTGLHMVTAISFYSFSLFIVAIVAILFFLLNHIMFHRVKNSKSLEPVSRMGLLRRLLSLNSFYRLFLKVLGIMLIAFTAITVITTLGVLMEMNMLGGSYCVLLYLNSVAIPILALGILLVSQNIDTRYRVMRVEYIKEYG